MNGDELINRGKQAALLLESPLFVEAAEAVERRLFNEWKNALDREQRNELWAISRAFELVKRYIRDVRLAGDQQAERDAEDQKLSELERIDRITHPERYED